MNQQLKLKRWAFFTALSILCMVSRAQLTQQIRGTVVEQGIQKPLAGATVVILPSKQTVITDIGGNFRFGSVPIGNCQLAVTYAGYKEVFIENLQVIAGKELVLTLPMEISVKSEEQVIVKGILRKNRPLNEMSLVSARAFSVEETQRYAAAVNDPLRMATAFPGVLAADDGNNSIVIRGNNPAGLLWKMEGLDIPNPNHFGYAAMSGGGISILSAQLLSNSDFLTAAFPAEYGNALSGVFDLHLRKGNNEKREYTLQAGILGLNAAAEGPIAPFYNGSYLVNYRYSTLSLLSKAGVLPNDVSSTDFQDLSFNVYLPTAKSGNFNFFGFGGLSKQDMKADLDSSKWENSYARYPAYFVSNTGMSGLTHSIFLGTKTNLLSAIGWSYSKNSYDERYIEDNYSESDNFNADYRTRKWMLQSTLNHKFNKSNQLRAGLSFQLIHFSYYQQSKENPNAPIKEVINDEDNTQTMQAYLQWQQRPADKITITAGLHYMQLLLNQTSAFEPRAGLRWDVDQKNSLSFGYGLHSQIQGLGLYFARYKNPDGTYELTNHDIGFTKAHHWVLSHSYMPAKNWRIKTEVYYQQLFDVPVGDDTSKAFSILNTQGEYITDSLHNSGKGRNYGVEISLEKYLASNYYFSISTSLYQSKYRAADGIERNTRYNGNYIINAIGGKEFVYRGKSRSFGINVKVIYAGGLRTTPINFDASQQAGYTIYYEKQAFSQQNPAYFRTDLRLSMKWNKRHFTGTISLDFQNLTNRLNIFNQSYDALSNKIITNYQTGIIPVLNYKVEF